MKYIYYFILLFAIANYSYATKYFYKTYNFGDKQYLTNCTIDKNIFLIGYTIYDDPINNPKTGFVKEIGPLGDEINNYTFNSLQKTHTHLFDLHFLDGAMGLVGTQGGLGVTASGFYKIVNSNEEEIYSYYTDTTLFTTNVSRSMLLPNHSIILIGSIVNNENTYPYLIKLDAQANFLWDTTYLDIPSHAWIQDIALSSDGGLYLFMTIGSSQFSSDALLMKTDSLGNQEWGKIFNYAAQDAAVKILESKEGGFLVALFAAFGKPRIVKLDEDRNIEFVLDNIFTDHIADIVQLEDSTYIIMGRAEIMDANWETHKTDIQLAKIDHEGNLLWSRIYEDNGYDKDKSMVASPDGGFMLACNKEVNQVDKIFLIKTNCLGLLTEPEASFTYEAAASEVAFTNTSIYVYPDSIDGGYYVWDFGDGSPVSNEVNPVHTYTEVGEYQVRLTGIVCSDTSVYEQTILVTTTSVVSPSSPSLEEALRVYPNPVDGDVLYFEVGSGYAGQQGRILFYNTLGQVVLGRENSRIFSKGKNKIDVSNLPGGVYFVVVEIGGERVVEKVVVN